MLVLTKGRKPDALRKTLGARREQITNSKQHMALCTNRNRATLVGSSSFAAAPSLRPWLDWHFFPSVWRRKSFFFPLIHYFLHLLSLTAWRPDFWEPPLNNKPLNVLTERTLTLFLVEFWRLKIQFIVIDLMSLLFYVSLGAKKCPLLWIT